MRKIITHETETKLIKHNTKWQNESFHFGSIASKLKLFIATSLFLLSRSFQPEEDRIQNSAYILQIV